MKKDKNNKYIDENNIVYINIRNKKGEEFTALYSGNHIEEVMNTNWCVVLRENGKVDRIQTGNFNKTMKKICLHQVDLGSWVDHINNNPLDNRIENLRKSNPRHNSRNKNSKGYTDITGLGSSGKGWRGTYKDSKSGFNIYTKTKYDIEEVKLDCLIAQRYMNYRHNDDLFYLLDKLPIERIKEVEDLLECRIIKARNKIHKEKEYEYNIKDYNGYYKLTKNECEMLFNCGLDFIKNKRILKSSKYWECNFVENGKKIKNIFHKEILGLRPNEYSEYNLNVDHLNGNPSDNRYENLAITTAYSNQCNKQGCGYRKNKNGSYKVEYMKKYKFWDLIGGLKTPTFNTEKEAIIEVERRREIIERNRVKLNSKDELERLIQYCLDNKYILENGLANLDLGYLYWKKIY